MSLPGAPVWNDERVEIFFYPGMAKNVRFCYLTTNPDGIYSTNFGDRFKKNDIQVKRYADRFEVYFRVKKEWCGTTGGEGHLWRLNA